MSKTLILPTSLRYNDQDNNTVSSFLADKIVKTGTDIIGYDASGNELFAFRGISDFSQFTLEDGQVFDTENDPMIDLQMQNAQILLNSAQQAQTISDLQTQNAAIMLQLAQMGGAS
jgi:hypothetical protein